MKKQISKKGFTIVELIIVIAVIGILAAILIPTFSSIIKKGNYSAFTSTVKNLNTAVVSEIAEQSGDKTYTLSEAMQIVKQAGFPEDVTDTKNAEYDIVWVGQVGETHFNKFAVVEKNKTTQKMTKVVFPEDVVASVNQMPSTWLNASNLQSTNVPKATSLAECNWSKDVALTLAADETVSSYKILKGAWTIDLNGHNFDLGGSGDIYVQGIVGGALTITDSTGTGSITSNGATIIAYYGATVTVNSGIVTTTSSQYSVLQAGSGATNSASLITVNGGEVSATGGAAAIFVKCPEATVEVHGGKVSAINRFAISGNGSAGQGGTKINITGGEIVATNAPAIYHPQDGVMNISGGKIKTILSDGSDSVCDAINIKSGTINISGGIISTEAYALEDLLVSYSNGAESVGAAVGIVSNDSYAGNLVVNITGGTFLSAHGYAFAQIISPGNTSSIQSITISDGTFTGYNGQDIRVTSNENVTIDIDSDVNANITRVDR